MILQRFQDKDYRGLIRYPDRALTFGCAGLGDVAQLAALYRAIAVTPANYRVKLNPDHPRNFAHTGGMFLVHDEASIRREILSGKSFFAVAREPGGQIAASFWVSSKDPQFEDFSPAPEGFSENPGAYPSLVRALREGTVVYPRELIVAEGCSAPKLAHLMFYTIFCAMSRKGYTHSLGEVYKAWALRDSDGRRVIDLLNTRSFEMTHATGGYWIGIFPHREVELGSFAVTIESRIFCFDYSNMLPRMAQSFAESEIQIVFGEAV